MLKIRLARVGRRNIYQYRVVVTEHSKPAKSGYQAVLGSYDPRKTEGAMSVDAETTKAWIAKGAKPSDRVHGLLAKAGIIEAKKYPTPVSKKEKTEAPKVKVKAEPPKQTDKKEVLSAK